MKLKDQISILCDYCEESKIDSKVILLTLNQELRKRSIKEIEVAPSKRKPIVYPNGISPELDYFCS